MPARPRLGSIAALLVAAALLALAGAMVARSLGGATLGPDDPRRGVEADTARFTYGGREVEVPLDACGREGDTVVMAGRQGSVVLQVGADVSVGGEVRTGVTVDLGADGILGAFGADVPPGPAGEIRRVSTVGDALVVDGSWVGFDDDLRPLPGAGAGVDGTLVARCPETDDSQG
jgi:hypothetical protein